MRIRKLTVAVLASAAAAFGSTGASAQTACQDVDTIGEWATVGTCRQADKDWTFGARSTNLLDSVLTIFTNPGVSTHALNITGFDDSDAAAAWWLEYTITVNETAPAERYIRAMFAGADNPGGGSLLTKDVTGDATFSLSVVNGAEGPASEKQGLNAKTLAIREDWSVDVASDLLSVSNTYRQEDGRVPEPMTLSLLGLGLAGLGLTRRRKRA